MNESFFDPMPRVVAHRGDSAHFPENTLSAFLSACTLGVDAKTGSLLSGMTKPWIAIPMDRAGWKTIPSLS